MGMQLQMFEQSNGTTDDFANSWRVGSTTASLLLLTATLCTGCTPDQAGGFGRAMFYGMIVALILIPTAFIREYRRGSKMSAAEQASESHTGPGADAGSDAEGDGKGRPDAD